jgi:16S rRNA (guanine527-N7)-methyltransferase
LQDLACKSFVCTIGPRSLCINSFVFRTRIIFFVFPGDLGVQLTRLADLLGPFAAGLSAQQLEQVLAYMGLLLKWNARMNLTAIRDEESIATRHFGESFFLALQLPSAAQDVTDLGSGAGFPGIPIKIARPDLPLTLIEAQQRKATFLREVLRTLQIAAEVKNVRAETLPKGTASLVTLRAVEKFDSILPVAAGLVRPATEAAGPGSLAILIGSAQAQRVREILPHWRFQPEIPIPSAENRVILQGEPR